MGISGFEKKKKWLFALFITACSLLVLLAGPSSALLLIPQRYVDWGAGGATFYLVGTKESIWPSHLDAQSIGGAHCQSPSASLLSSQQLNMSSCIWSGYQSILQWFESSHLGKNINTVSMQDGKIERNIYFRYNNLGATVYGISLAPCSFAKDLASIWNMALSRASIAVVGSLSRTANLAYRNRPGTTVSMNSQLPVVQTMCLTNYSVNFADIINQVSRHGVPCMERRHTDVYRLTTLCNSSIHQLTWLH